MPLQVNCPSCGGPVEFKSSISLLAVCPYCRSALIRKDLDIENLGKVAQLHQDGSVLQVGTQGQFQRVAFSIVGRIQLKYDSGFWNEWFMTFQDGKSGWLGVRLDTGILMPVVARLLELAWQQAAPRRLLAHS